MRTTARGNVRIVGRSTASPTPSIGRNDQTIAPDRPIDVTCVRALGGFLPPQRLSPAKSFNRFGFGEVVLFLSRNPPVLAMLSDIEAKNEHPVPCPYPNRKIVFQMLMFRGFEFHSRMRGVAVSV